MFWCQRYEDSFRPNLFCVCILSGSLSILMSNATRFEPDAQAPETHRPDKVKRLSSPRLETGSLRLKLGGENVKSLPGVFFYVFWTKWFWHRLTSEYLEHMTLVSKNAAFNTFCCTLDPNHCSRLLIHINSSMGMPKVYHRQHRKKRGYR